MIEAKNTAAAISATEVGHAAWYNALTLKERLVSFIHRPQENARQQSGSSRRAVYKLKRWKAQRPFDREDFFAERLATDAITEEELLTLLDESLQDFQDAPAESPAWLQDIERALADPALADISHVFKNCGLTDEYIQQLEKTFKQSFLSVIQPMIALGIQRFHVYVGEICQRYEHPPFRRDLVVLAWLENLPHHLLHRLNRTLILELHVARLEKRLDGSTSEERFQQFLEYMNSPERRRAFLQEYAPLARLLMKHIDNWVAYGCEFLEHLCGDWHDVCNNFFAGADPGMLIEARSGMGDHHKSGRSTIMLRFASGQQLVYKPRSVAVDLHFQHLLSWLNQHGCEQPFKTITILDKDTYGWSEFVRAEGCQSEEEIRRFYQRQGAYLALLYTLNATDLHYENLIAAGEMPVLIDLESLFHPHLPIPLSNQADAAIWKHINASVLRIGLLPMHIWGNAHSRGVDLSGLGGQAGQQTPRPILQFTASGTDEMHVIRKHAEIPPQHNRPQLEGKDVNAFDYWQEIIKGFTWMYRVLEQHKDELLAGPIKAFEQDQIRVIVRPTQSYAVLLHESYHPDFLRNALDRDYFFDHLWQRVPEQPFLKKIIAAEQEDLHAGDIPLFTTTPVTTDIYSSRGACIADFCTIPSIEPVRERIQNLCPADMQRQIWFIQAAFATATLNQNHTRRFSSQTAPASPPQPVSKQQLLQAACKIGDRLGELAVRDTQGVRWLSLSLINEKEWQILPAGIDLYNGVAGIALFLAYLGAITGNATYRTLAEEAVYNVEEQLKSMQHSVGTIGAFSGWGAIIYLYTHLAVLWHQPHFLELAEEAVKLSVDQIEDDSMLDMMAGAAGYISALLSLYSVKASSLVLSAAVRAGNHLVKNLQSLKYGEVPQLGIASTSPLTGLSHGMAGYALSLLRLACVSGDSSYREAAITAIAYERSVFSAEKQNWPDFRDMSEVKHLFQNADSDESDKLEFMTTWCHGAAGIGLSRLASLPYIDDAHIRDEIDIALHTTLREGFGWGHSLCHGDMGNLDVFLTASNTPGTFTSHERVQQLLENIWQGIEEHGYVTGAPFGLEVPGLMVGISGIGYELLRYVVPEQVPSVLTLEPPHRGV